MLFLCFPLLAKGQKAAPCQSETSACWSPCGVNVIISTVDPQWSVQSAAASSMQPSTAPGGTSLDSPRSDLCCGEKCFAASCQVDPSCLPRRNRHSDVVPSRSNTSPQALQHKGWNPTNPRLPCPSPQVVCWSLPLQGKCLAKWTEQIWTAPTQPKHLREF